MLCTGGALFALMPSSCKTPQHCARAGEPRPHWPGRGLTDLTFYSLSQSVWHKESWTDSIPVFVYMLSPPSPY